MGRAKGVKSSKIAESARRARHTRADMAIEERLTECSRGDHNSIVYIGELVERHLKGEMGAILKALTAGRVSSELYLARTNGLSSDRILGRLEMADIFWNDLEQFVHDKDKAIKILATDLPHDEKYVEGSVESYNFHP